MSTQWNLLLNHKLQLDKVSIKNLFENEKDRFLNKSIKLENFIYDYSKQKVNDETIDLLIKLANEKNLEKKILQLFNSENVNVSENRPALHTALRSKDNVIYKGKNLKDDIKVQLNKISDLTKNLHAGKLLNEKGKKITDVISIGIGGSDLGPVMVNEALKKYKKFNVYFISNVDSYSLEYLLKKVNVDTTICIINSKSFSTTETLEIAEKLKKVINNNRLYAVTANFKKAIDFGVNESNIFEFWDWVGGRYSLWSTIGLSISLCLGFDIFTELLEGARLMDEHFKNEAFHKNIPVIMGLIGIWNNNFLNMKTLAVLPYSDRLKFFPSYLQQLEMESNGKSANLMSSEKVKYDTTPILWGDVGCNCQHSFMQLLHQGTQVVPVDFIIHASNDLEHDNLNETLIASCLSQSKALMEGKKGEVHKDFTGDRPSSTILLDKLSAKTLGMLISLYEHKVFVQSVIWGINPFDQWGVQLGKELLPSICGKINSDSSLDELDDSTKGLIQNIRKFLKG